MSPKRKKNKNKIQAKTIGFVSLGCAKNTVDSEKMLGKLIEAGYLLSYDIAEADVVIINTCGFIAPAKAEAIEVIKEAAGYKNQGSVRKVVVTGCLSERMGKKLLDEVAGIDAVIGLEQRDEIADIVAGLDEKGSGNLFLSRPAGKEKIKDDRGRLLINPQHWAYLRISEGCDRRCSFCTIPMIKGRFRSKPLEQVVDEAQELVQAGAVELSIIAQDSNYYGKDLKIKNALVKLIGELEKIDKLKWIRLMYLYPAGLDDLLIEKIAASEKIVNYIDMPIQHINNRILKDMSRVDTREKTIELIEKLRKAMSNVVLRTTVIAGFAGESRKEFEELVDFLKWARFDALGCFAYCREQGTRAAELTGHVPEDVKQRRANEVMEVQQQIVFEKNEAMIGTELICLVDEKNADNHAIGRFYGQAPHIDSACIIENCTQMPGQFVKCRVTGYEGYDLKVVKIS